MSPDEKSKLAKCKQLLDERITKIKSSLTRIQGEIGRVTEKAKQTETVIKDYFWRAIQYLLEEDRRLIRELHSHKEKQVRQLHADIDDQFKSLSLYNDRLKQVEKALESGKCSDNDLSKDVLSMCETKKKQRNPPVKEALFVNNQSELFQTLKDLKHELVLLPIPHHQISVESPEDKTEPDIRCVAVTEADGLTITLVSDWANKSIKSLYRDNTGTRKEVLVTGGWPFGITVTNTNDVFVTDPVLRKIFKVTPYPKVRIVSSISTDKMYCGLDSLEDSNLVASGYVWLKSWASYWTVDVLDTNGTILRTIRHKSMTNPEYICTSPKGNIIVSDKDNKSLIIFSSEDDDASTITLTEKDHSFPQGVAVTHGGNIIITDTASNKVIEMTKSGEILRNIVTSADGINSPRDACFDEQGLLYVACTDCVKVYTVE